jgi:NarL family two-component system sensor histidine kinase YdfH
MSRDDTVIRMEIRDNGQGFDPRQLGKHPGHYGLLGIRERVRIIGGSFEIDSGTAGTSIRIEAPLQKGETDET